MTPSYATLACALTARFVPFHPKRKSWSFTWIAQARSSAWRIGSSGFTEIGSRLTTTRPSPRAWQVWSSVWNDGLYPHNHRLRLDQGPVSRALLRGDDRGEKGDGCSSPGSRQLPAFAIFPAKKALGVGSVGD